MNKKYGFSVELFGSAFNVTLDKYFGLFYDIEKPFGCYGNFFNCTLISGLYVANPPFETNIMNRLFNILLESLDNNSELTFYLTIPVWDTKDRIKLNMRCKSKLITNYKTDLNTQLLHNSKYNIHDNLLCKEDYQYLDYINTRMVNYAATNIIVLSNKLSEIKIL